MTSSASSAGPDHTFSFLPQTHQQSGSSPPHLGRDSALDVLECLGENGEQVGVNEDGRRARVVDLVGEFLREAES
jgi:hypothetical protein